MKKQINSVVKKLSKLNNTGCAHCKVHIDRAKKILEVVQQVTLRIEIKKETFLPDSIHVFVD